MRRRRIDVTLKRTPTPAHVLSPSCILYKRIQYSEFALNSLNIVLKINFNIKVNLYLQSNLRDEICEIVQFKKEKNSSLT